MIFFLFLLFVYRVHPTKLCFGRLILFYILDAYETWHARSQLLLQLEPQTHLGQQPQQLGSGRATVVTLYRVTNLLTKQPQWGDTDWTQGLGRAGDLASIKLAPVQETGDVFAGDGCGRRRSSSVVGSSSVLSVHQVIAKVFQKHKQQVQRKLETTQNQENCQEREGTKQKEDKDKNKGREKEKDKDKERPKLGLAIGKIMAAQPVITAEEKRIHELDEDVERIFDVRKVWNKYTKSLENNYRKYSKKM